MMDRMARWALRYDAAGPIHLGQRLGHLEQDPRVFRAVVYDKGAWVLHMLRGVVGDEAFFAGARAFLGRFRYAKAGTEDLRAALEEASGRDLRPYFERLDLRDRAADAPVVGADGEDGRRLPHDGRGAAAGPARAPAAAGGGGVAGRPRGAHRHPRAGGRLLDDRHRPGAAARDAERRPRAARPGRAGRPRAGPAPSAVAVAAALFLERRDPAPGSRRASACSLPGRRCWPRGRGCRGRSCRSAGAAPCR